MSNRFRGHVAKWAEASLWILGGICVATFAFAQLTAEVAQKSAIQSIRDRASTVDQSLWSASRIEHYERATNFGNSELALGVLSIPSIDLEVAIFEGTSERVLNLGIGRVAGTARPGDNDNSALAGHRDGFFRGLKNIAVGDELILETEDQIERYDVVEIFVVAPEDTYVLDQSGEPTITLITCYPFYVLGHAPQRFIVRAKLKENTL